MKRAWPILLLIAILAVTAASYFFQIKNSHGYAFGWRLTAFDIFMALPLVFALATAVWLIRTQGSHKHTATISSIERGFGSRTVGPPSLSLMALILAICLLCWFAGLVFIYVADDLTSPALNERSVPAPKTY